MAVRREIDQADADRWASLRADAHARLAQVLDDMPPAALDALAWKAGTMTDLTAHDALVDQLIERARAERFHWREISEALGLTDGDQAASQVRSRHERRMGKRA